MSSKVQAALESRKKRKEEEEKKRFSVDNALASRDSRIKENLQSTLTDFQNSFTKEVESYNSLKTLSFGTDLKVVLDSTNESRVNLGNLKRTAEAYRKYIGDDKTKAIVSEIEKMESGYNSYLSSAELFSAFKTEDDYKKWVADNEEYEKKKTYDLAEGEKELSFLEGILSEAKGYQGKAADAKRKNKVWQGRGGMNAPGGTGNASQYEAKLANLLKENGYSSIDEIEKAISSKKVYYNQAKRIQEGIRLSGVADPESELYDPEFEKNSGYISTKSDAWHAGLTSQYGLGYDDLAYEYINNVDGIRNEINDKARTYGKDTSQYAEKGYDHLTEQEVAIYNYYYAKEGKDAAEKYLDSIQETLNQRKANEKFKDFEGNTFSEILFGIPAGVDQFESGIKNLFNFNDDYIPTSSTQMVSQMVREDLGDDGWELPEFLGGSSLGQVAYDITNTTSNMLPSIIVGSVTNPVVGASLLGASAAGNAYQEMLNYGYDKGQARFYSTLVGVSEAGLEYVLGGISKLGGKATGGMVTKLLSKIDNAYARAAIRFGGSMLSEGFEEGLQEYLEPWFKSIALNTDYEAANLEEILYSGLLGALSAFGLEGTHITSSELATYSQGKNLKTYGEVDRLAELGKTFSADTVANQIASKVNKDTGAYTIGRLLNEVGASLSESNITDITNALVERGIDKNQADTIAKWMANTVNGAELTNRQQAALENNPVLADVWNDAIINPNSTVMQRSMAYNQIANRSNTSVSDTYGDPEVVKALVDEGLASPDGSQSKTLATEYSKILESGKSLSNNQIQKLVDANKEQITTEEKAAKADAEVKESVDNRKFSVSDDGKTINTKTGEHINIAEIASIKNGDMILKTKEGETVNAKDVSLSESDALIYSAVLDMGVNAASANAIIGNYDPSEGITASQYVLGVKEAYKYGRYSIPAREMSIDGFSADLSEAQRTLAYKLGASDAKHIAEAAHKAVEAKKANTAEKKSTAKGKLHFAGNRTALTERQSVSIKALEKISEAMGVDIYVYESKVKNGRRVYTDRNGNEVSAPNGFYDKSDGSIHIDLNAGNNGEGVMLFTAAHELTHFIKQWSPQKFKVLADFLMEQYGKKGVSVDSLVREQIVKAKKNGRDISYDVAYEEVVADSMETMLSDGKVLEKLALLKQTDKTLFDKIKSYIDNLVAKIKDIYKGLVPNSREAQLVSEMKGAVEKLQALFTDALVDASENYVTNDFVNMDADSESVAPMLSERTWTQSEYVTEREKTANAISKALGVDIQTAYKYIDDINGVARLIADDRVRLDYEPNMDDKATVLKPNSEYKYTVDMSTLCAKRLIFTGTFDAIQKALPNTVFDSEDIVGLREMMMAKGYEVACGICYVESTRREIGRITQEFIDRYKVAQKTGKPISRINSKGNEVVLKSAGRAFNADKAYTPSLGELNTTDIDLVKRDHPEVYDAYLAFMNARGQAKPKLLETRAEYKGEILKHFKSKSAVDARNRAGGLRLQSFSDFEVPHLIDMMQVVMDMSRVGLKSQAYTKVPNFAEAFGNTGVKINLSLIAKGSGLDSNGNLVFDDVEGINHEEAFRLREKFSKNVGTILVGKSDAHIIAAMADPRIDFIIPFHKSSWKESLYDALGLTGYADYTETQNEKPTDKSRAISNFDPSEYWDYSKTGDENAQIYLQKCKEDGRIPKFPQFQNYPGYWKLLIDFKMYDNDGVGSPQEVVQPIFDSEANEKILRDYKGGHRSFPVAKDVVKEFVEQHSEHSNPIMYSDRVTDKETLDFLENQDHVTVYRAMQLIDGKLYPPMNAYTYDESGKKVLMPHSEIGAWEQAVERPDLIDPKTGKFKLDKGKVDSGKRGTAVPAAYNPYIHTSLSMLNDQFTSAYQRSNLVVVKGVVPKSELTSGYHAQYAKDSVGETEWHSGVVSTQLPESRKVILSRWFKPVEVLDNDVVAQNIKEMLGDTGIEIPYNVVSPKLRRSLEKIGVPIGEGRGIRNLPAKNEVLYSGDDIIYQKKYAKGNVVGTNLGIKEGEASLHEVKDLFNRLNSNAEIGEFAKSVFATAEKLGVNIRFASELLGPKPTAPGVNFGDMVEYNTSFFNDKTISNQSKAKIILHELIHICTAYAIENNEIAAKRLNRIYNEIKNDPAFAGKYGIKNSKEMAAELANEDFVRLLKKKNLKKNLWDRIVDWICDLFGFKRGTTAYENARLCVDDIISNPDVSMYKSYAEELRRAAREEGLDAFGSTTTEDGRVLYSERGYAPTFYSQMGKVVEGVKQEKLAANSVVNMLRGKGVKAEEIRWSGIVPFLEGKKSVTKQDLLDFINGSMLQIGEQMSSNDIDLRYDSNTYSYSLYDRDGNVINKYTYNDFIGGYVSEKDDEIYTYSTDIEDAVREEYGELSSPRWADYKLDGGENYREIVFTLPNSSYRNQMMRVHWGDDAEGVLAHARIQDFNVGGKKMLFIEEIQSDYHNEGHQSGYNNSETDAKIDELKAVAEEKFFALEDYSTEMTGNAGEWETIEKTEKGAKLLREYREAQDAYDSAMNEYVKRIPDAPFKDTYHEYVLKRLLRMAAENGYDSIGWTTADIQSKRWSDEYAEGYRIEYDQDIPKFLRRYGKQWGATVGSTTLKNGTEVWSMDITDSMKNSVLYEGQVMYQDRSTEDISNRGLLAKALESAATTGEEKNLLRNYKTNIRLIESEQKKLSEIKDKLFAKGSKIEPSERKKLQFEMKQTSNRINSYDRELLKLEAMQPIKKVLAREKEMAKKRQRQKDMQLLADYKEKSKATVRELLERNQESRKKAIERRDMAIVRNKIKDFKRKLESTLLRPTDRLYVPFGLVQAVVDVCDIINTDTDLYKKDGTINKAQEQRNLTKEKLQALKDEYEKLKDYEDPVYSGEFDDAVYYMLKDLRERYDGRSLKEMNLGELSDMYDILRSIGDTLADARKLIGKGEAYDVYEAGEAIISEQGIVAEKRKKDKRNGIQKAKDSVINLSLSPVRNVERMSGHKEGSVFVALFNDFEIGVRQKNIFEMESKKNFEGVTTGKNAKTYESAVYDAFGNKEYVDDNGRKFGISKMQMMQAILSHDREKANKMHHIKGGGLVFADLKMLRKGKLSEAISSENSHLVSNAESLIEQFRQDLANDAWAKKYMDLARGFFDGKAKDAINTTMLALKHRIVAKDKSYIPFEVDKNFVVREISAANDIQQTINAYGMLQETKDKAPQPLIMTGLNNIIDRHIDQVSTVVGLAIPVRNFNKVWNVHSVEGVNTTVNKEIETNWGKEGKKFIEQVVQDIQGPRHNTQSEIYKAVKSGYIGATFLLNGSVVTKQIGSLFSATSMLRWRDPANMIGNLLYTMANYNKIAAEVDQYTASAWTRRQGMSDAEVYTLLTEGKKNVITKAINKLPAVFNPAKWITAMDSAVALSLWKYAKQDVKKMHPELSGEELNRATAAFYDSVIENTQSMTDVLHRPEIQKRSDVVSEAFGMFKTDLYQMSGQLQNAIGRYGDNKSKDNAKRLGKTVYSIVASSAWGLLMTTVFALLRYKVNPYRDDEEDDELTVESWLKKQAFALGGDLMGYILPLFGSEVVGTIENIVYGESEDIVDSLALTAINDLYSTAVDIASSLKEGDAPSVDDYKNLITKSLQVFGIPAHNIVRTIEAISLHAQDIANGEFFSFEAGRDKTEGQALYEAILRGNGDQIEKLKSGFDDEEDIDTALRKALRENDPRIKEAAQARIDGDISKYKSIVKDIASEGHFSQDLVVKAINSEINAINKEADDANESSDDEEESKATSIYKASDINAALENGDTSAALEVINDLVKVKTENYIAEGEKKKDAEKKARSSVKSSVTSYWKPLYLAAYKSKNNSEMARIRKILNSTKLYDNVVETCQDWVKQSK